MVEQLERLFNPLLQQKINFSVNGKVIKNGKLVLFSVKDFYLNFTLITQNVKKIYEIPYPYSYFFKKGNVVLDYSLSKFHHNITDIINYSRLVQPKRPTKFFDTYVELSVEKDK